MNASWRVLLPAFLLTAGLAQAQSDFRPGYVLPFEGDTLRGLVDNRGALRSAARCSFRPSAQAAVVSYGPTELRGYGFSQGKHYRSRVMPAPKVDDDVTPPPTLYFLEVVVDGRATLYSRRDENDATRYYLQKANGPVRELIHEQKMVNIDSHDAMISVDTFRGVLSEAFVDCPVLQSTVGLTVYKPSELIRAVTNYNQCVEPRPVLVEHRAAPRTALGVVVGAQVSQLYFTEPDDLRRGSFVAGVAPVLGLSLQLINPALNERLMLRLEPSYARQDYEAEFSAPSGGFPNATRQARFRLDYLRLPVVLRYTVPKGRVRPFVELGASVGQALHIKAEDHRRFTSSGTYGEWQPLYTNEDQLQRVELGALAGLGADLPSLGGRSLSVMGRVERSTGFVAAVPYNSFAWRYYLLLGVNLTK